MNEAHSTAVSAIKVDIPSLLMNETELCEVLQNSIYPGAKLASVKLVIGYCRAGQLDPLQKSVHIVPMDIPTGEKDKEGWDIKVKRDVVMPGIGLYRIQAARTGEHAGTSEPEFGEDVTVKLGETNITYPKWCKVTVRRLRHGLIVDYVAKELWIENYATKGRKPDPNAMWKKRPYAQLAKCAEAQALRKGFPEFIGNAPTAEEMEGKPLDDNLLIDQTTGEITGGVVIEQPRGKNDQPAQTGAGNAASTTTQQQPAGDKKAEPEQEGTKLAGKPIDANQMKPISLMMQKHGVTAEAIAAKFGMPLEQIDWSKFAEVMAYIKGTK